MQEPINNQSMLKVGTILRGTYRIDSYLSSGGFGNTYVATNIEFEERVAIKEFFMKGVTHRDDNQTTISVSNAENRNSFLEQKEKFKKEARRIRQLHNPGLVSVYDLFEENGTAYYVMDYIEGENLSERLKRIGRPMKEEEVNEIFLQIVNSLKIVHDNGIWHLDLKPANIMIDSKRYPPLHVKIIDFGASKQMNTQNGGATTSTAISYTSGYAPREQMEQNYDKFGPWTDIYALGATFYNLLTNRRPPLPSDIDDDTTDDKHIALPFPDSVSSGMKHCILQMMSTNRNNRPQSMAEVESLFLKSESESDGSTSNQDTVYNEKVKTDCINDEDEETLIATPQPKKEEKKPEPQQTPKVETRTAQISYTSGSQYTPNNSNNDTTNVWKAIGIVIAIITAVTLIKTVISDFGSQKESKEQKVESVEPATMNSNDEVSGESTTSKNGYFEESYPDGSSYKGNFKDGLFHGQGVYTWANGDKYEGEWTNGSRSKGTYTWPEKRKGYMYKYIGEFKNNEFEGKGTGYFVGGETESGIWKNGKYMGSEAEQDLTSLERKVVGKHLLSLQWISWDYFGTCEITKVNNGKYRCVGSQHSKENSDYLKLEGYISIVNENHLRFTGTIITRLHDMNNGNEHIREGTFDFKSTGGRKYWREQEMTGSDGCTDYIDIYFQKK